MMKLTSEIFCFSIDQQKVAIPLAQVEKVIQAVSVQGVPESSPRVLGLINYHGNLLPVVNFRKRLGLEEKPLAKDDSFILAATSKRLIVIVATDIHGITEIHENEIASYEDLGLGIGLKGITRQTNGIFFIFDLDTFLTNEDDILLDELLAANKMEKI